MGIAPRRKSKIDRKAIHLTAAQCREYLSGKREKCFCGSDATNRGNHLRRYHEQPPLKLIRAEKSENYVDCKYHKTVQECSKKRIYLCREAAMKNYVERVQKYVKEAIGRLEKKVEHSDSETREHADAKEMLGYLKTAGYGCPISYSQYMRKGREKFLNEFVFCTKEEATDILSRGPLKIPILIPCPPMTAERSERLSRCQREIKKGMADMTWVDVYDSGKKDFPRVPGRMSGSEALRRFESTDECPVNALNNPIPQGIVVSRWMANIVGYNMAETLMEKAQEANLRQILKTFLHALIVLLVASTGAITLRHIDKSAETTCIESIMGSKLWEISEDRSQEAVQNFAEKGTCSSGTFVLLVDEGDTLIQPPQTIHSVYTLKKSMLFCEQYLDSRTTLSSLKQTQLEVEYDHITNDDHHEGLLPYLDIAVEKWTEDDRLEEKESWPDAKDLEEAKDILEKIRWHKKTSSPIPQTKANTPRTKRARAKAGRGARRVGIPTRK